jgi:cyclase
VGGGLRTVDDMRAMLQAGADKVSINSAAVADPALIGAGAEQFGSQCIVVAIDARRRQGGWEVYTHGGRKPTGIDAIAWVQEVVALGAGEILLTSMDRDGTAAGYDIDLLRAASAAANVPIIASGGAGQPEHFWEALAVGGADAALAATLFHYQQLTVPELKRYLIERGLPIRPVEARHA